MPAPDPLLPVPAPTVAQQPDPGPAAHASADEDVSAVRLAWRLFKREPMLLVTIGYVFISLIGLSESYWFYQRFGLPILEYMQSSDYFVAGLRRPIYLLLFLFILATAATTMLPEAWSRRHPARAEAIRRRWWGRFVLPRRSDWWAYGGMHPATAASVVALAGMAVGLFSYSRERADDVYRGGGHAVRVTLAGQAGEMPGEVRLLGTSSAFVFLWWPRERVVQAVPVEGVGRIASVERASVAGPVPPATPAAKRQSARKSTPAATSP